MRLIHISDLHAGKTLGKASRNPDLEYALKQVIDATKDSGAEVVLVAGDVFDKANPDNESKELIFDFFLRLKDLASEVVVISGNHDSYDFMKSISGLSKLANVHIYDRPSRERFLYTYKNLKVACLPYPSERILTTADEDAKKSYAELVARFINFLARQVESAEHKILLAHLFVAGALYTRTEKEATLSQHYAVQPASLSEVFDYVALGHVHRYQRIENAPTYAYYTGSLYQLDFSEAGQPKAFNLIELGENQPKITPIELSLKNPLHQFELEQGDVLDKIEELKKKEGYLKLSIRVSDRTGMPALIDKLREELKDKLLKIEQLIPDSSITPESQEDIKGLDPLELYRRYFKSTYDKDLPEEVEKRFIELLRSVEGHI